MRSILKQDRKKAGRGMAQASLDLIDAMATIAEAVQPITGGGFGYKLFTQRLIPAMDNEFHAAGVSPAADRPRAGHHSVGVYR
jgi:hypothetical protein